MNISAFFRNHLKLTLVLLLLIIAVGSSVAAYTVMRPDGQKSNEVTHSDSDDFSETLPANESEEQTIQLKKTEGKSEDKKTKKNISSKQGSKESKSTSTKPGTSSTPTSKSPSPSTPSPSVPSSQMKNCISVPSKCGYPDQTNTGVKPGSTLTNRGSMSIIQDGTVIQNVNLTGQIIIRANNVTIKNSRITSGDYYPIDYEGSGLLVEDVEIIGTNTNVTAGLSFSNYTARRVNIHGTVDGFKGDSNVLVEDSYVHDLRYDAVRDTHNDGYQVTGGSNVTVRHSTFKLGGVAGISSIFQMGHEWGPNSNWLIENNLLDGGGWVFNARDTPSMFSNITIRNNRITRAHGYGPGYQIPNSTWTGNYYDDNLAPINR